MPPVAYSLAALSMALLPERTRGNAMDPAIYTLEWVPLAAGSSRAQAKNTIQSDADFVGLLGNMQFLTTASPPVVNASPVALFGLKIKDRDVFDRDIPVQNFFGNAQLPGAMIFPLYVNAAATITGFLTNQDPGVAFNVRASFHGYIVYNSIGRGRGLGSAGTSIKP